MIQLKIKKLNNKAIIPSYAKEGDACFDLTSTSIKQTDLYIEYGTGLAMEIPRGYVGLLFSRSSVTKQDLILKNSVGIIDSGYRGEIKLRFYETEKWGDVYGIGERVGQMMLVKIPIVEFFEVETLEDSDRSERGFGSTGN